MSLLELDGVRSVSRDGDHERAILRDVSLSLDAGELAVIWGRRDSGRSTLLRLAAGIQAPDAGVVRFDGRDLAARGIDVLGAGIGFCQQKLPPDGSQRVLELVMVSLLARGLSGSQARRVAREALERTDIDACAEMRVSSLETAEALRVALARVLALDPRLLVVDDPIRGVDLLERDGILLLLRSLADNGMAVLVSTGESTGLSGADRTLTLSEGVLRGPPAQELAPVVALHRRAERRAG
jgi:ABC-type multidrug transport system ATPase subunit